MIVRLNKYLADKGIASRRKSEEYIKQGLIKLNGKIVTEMGVKVDTDKDIVEISPVLKPRSDRFVYYALYKPVGYTCNVTGIEKPNITELLTGIKEKVFPVGRLDKMTCGLLLLTNDGRFSYEITNPEFGKEKEYVVKISEKLTPDVIQRLEKGFYMKGQAVQPTKIIYKGHHLFNVILKEGKNRQIRRMCQAAALHVEKLKRIRINNLTLGTLEPKEYRKLNKEEVRQLQEN